MSDEKKLELNNEELKKVCGGNNEVADGSSTYDELGYLSTYVFYGAGPDGDCNGAIVKSFNSSRVSYEGGYIIKNCAGHAYYMNRNACGTSCTVTEFKNMFPYQYM